MDNFAKYDHEQSDEFNRNYDYDSIMHYGKHSFAIDRSKPTIIAINDPNKAIGQRERLSIEDVIQLNALYRCQGENVLTIFE